MEDASRHAQIEALAELKKVLDDKGADELDVRDAAIRAVNRFDASIGAHHMWRPYSRRESADAKIRDEAARLGAAGVERHPEYRGRLRRRMGELIAEVSIPMTPKTRTDLNEWHIYLRCNEPWRLIAFVTGTLADAEMRGADALAELRDTANHELAAQTETATS